VDFPHPQPRFQLLYFLPCVGLVAILIASGTTNWVASSIGLVVYLLFSSVQTGLEISADMRQSRDYLALVRWRFGSWQPLPPVVGVTLKYYSTLEKASTSSATSWGVWNNPQRRHEEIIVMLSLQHSASGLIVAHFGADDVNAAIDFMHDTADRLRVPVHQYLPPHLYQPLPPATGGSLPG